MTDDIIVKLRSALQKDGDFPASAKVVNRLRELTNDPRTTAQQVTEVILTEPSLSTRILHLVNSSMYRRAKPIVTVSQAVVAVGMKSIAELCGGVVLLQRFIPLARKSSAFAGCFKRAMVTSLLSSSFSEEIGGKSEGQGNELGYISGFFSEIGVLLLAYYYPKIYELAEQRAVQKNISLGESLFQITGYTPIDMSSEIITALGLPAFYATVLQASKDESRLQQKQIRSLDEEKIVIAAKSSGAGHAVSSAISSDNPEEVVKALDQVEAKFGLPKAQSCKIVSRLPTIFKDHCEISEVDLPPMPSFLAEFRNSGGGTTQTVPVIIPTEAKFFSFMEEIKQSVENREPLATIITSAMEALKFGLGFDRAMLMLFDTTKKNMTARMGIGIDNFKVGIISKVFNENDSNSIANCMREGKVIYQGDPLIQGGWPFIYLPIGNIKKGPGLIYADRVTNKSELTDRDKANVSLLTELLARALSTMK